MSNTHAEVKDGYFICNNTKAYSPKKFGAKLEMKTTKNSKGKKEKGR
jgi:hypothetical protein